MVFAEAINEYLVTGLEEALAEADEPTTPVPLTADRYVALSAMPALVFSIVMIPVLGRARRYVCASLAAAESKP